MRVTYKNRKLEQICTNAKVSDKAYGTKMSEMIQLRIDQLHAASSVEMLISGKIGKCHSLIGNRKGQYAMTLIQPYRLVFEKENDELKIIRIIEIVDYH